MKKKTRKLHEFITNLSDFIMNHGQFRKMTKNKSESEMQTEIRPIIISYLENYYRNAGVKDYVAKANQSFYWEGQEGRYTRPKASIFATKNYPDFVIKNPYLIAIEYKKSASGSLVKQALGQSIMHTLSQEYDFALVIFHDENQNKKIFSASKDPQEREILLKLEKETNVFSTFF